MPTRTYGGVSAEDRVAERRARLMEAGLELFGTRGYSATGVKDVCRAAGVTDRYFYESFGDRKALFLAVFDARVDELFEAVVTAVAAAPVEPDAQLRAAIGTFLELVTGDPRTPRLVFSEPAAVGPEAEAHKREILRRFSQAASATARIHMRDDRLAQVVGLAIVGALERVVVEWQDSELHVSVPEVIEECTELFAGLFSGRGARRARS
jgi:AcrR family transcriptional regulator